MKCHFCSGEMKKGNTTYTVNRSGYHLLIDDFPAWICLQCKEVYFEESAVDNIQLLIKSLDNQVNSVREAALECRSLSGKGVKQQVISMIETLPEAITLDDIMAELYFMKQVDVGLKELDDGKGLPHEEIEKRIARKCKGYGNN
ncbi:MAG: YgiT-type zinc finger protein [Candidatus Methanoperedens sp.]|nr:YgiT-type zinc finger protein [Candidatus Methanoperedens sp.]